MSKKIIVAGAGHGGIAAGALLAKNGFDVTVYEKQKRKCALPQILSSVVLKKRSFTAISFLKRRSDGETCDE